MAHTERKGELVLKRQPAGRHCQVSSVLLAAQPGQSGTVALRVILTVRREPVWDCECVKGPVQLTGPRQGLWPPG